jgi:hypothetical protein
VQTVDLLVRGSGVEHLGQEVFDFGVVDSWSLRVDEVLFVSSVPSMQFQEPSRPYEFPPVEVGDVVIVGVGTSPNQVHSHRITSADGEVVVAATFLPLHLLNGHQSPWVLKFAAAVEEDDSVEFLHDARDLWDEQLAATVAELPAPMSDLEVIVAWVAEHDAVRAGEPPGAVISAHEPATSVGDRTRDMWYALPARERPLDVELTPPEVRETLVEVPILVDIEAAPQREDRFLVVKSDSGIVHAAVLAAGNHPATVLASPGDDWDIVVTDSPVGGADELLTSVSSAVWEGLRDGERLLIVYDGTPAGAAAFRPVNHDEVTALLAQWADDDLEEAARNTP